MLVPIGIGVAVAGSAYVCKMGVNVRSGTAAGIPWRVRFACWRWISEVKLGGKWKRAGTFPLRGGQLNAVQLALSVANAAAFGPGGSKNLGLRTVRVVRTTAPG